MHSNKDTGNQLSRYHNKHIAVVGMGVTGRACAKFLLQQGSSISVFDQKPLQRHELCKQIEVPESSNLEIYRLAVDTDLRGFDFVVLSPGITPQHPAILPIRYEQSTLSDLDIFAQFNDIPCIGVSGSNGKSTVVDMLQQSINASGKVALLGGNFGTCALDLLGQQADFIILELSSFQLEITKYLPLRAACILNITEDHIDRHGSFAAYAQAKQKIFEHASSIVVNRDDAMTQPSVNLRHASLQKPVLGQDSDGGFVSTASVSSLSAKSKVDLRDGDFWQDAQGIYCAGQRVIAAENLPLPLPHMMLNMQFVLALHKSLGLEIRSAIAVLEAYSGLPHRFELLSQTGNLTFINDSKATNPGACLAALNCAHQLRYRTILIAGGDAKGADLSILKTAIEQWVDWCIVYGKDAQLFSVFGAHVIVVETLEQAVVLAKQKAALMPQVSKLILLSPACASIDMFTNYQHRGERFKRAVFEEAA